MPPPTTGGGGIMFSGCCPSVHCPLTSISRDAIISLEFRMKPATNMHHVGEWALLKRFQCQRSKVKVMS